MNLSEILPGNVAARIARQYSFCSLCLCDFEKDEQRFNFEDTKWRHGTDGDCLRAQRKKQETQEQQIAVLAKENAELKEQCERQAVPRFTVWCPVCPYTACVQKHAKLVCPECNRIVLNCCGD